MSWLGEYVDLVGIELGQFMDGMTMSGTKVEGVERVGADISGVVVGVVRHIEVHPNADKLRVCLVDIGTEQLSIATGAENVCLGDFVPVAKVGAVLAGAREIGLSEIRGLPSQGMMCSIEELGFTRQEYPEASEYGIYIFPKPQELGADVVKLLRMREDVVEFEITSNRVDCFSMVGIAREAAATFGRELRIPTSRLREEGGSSADMVRVRLENPQACLRYLARVVENVVIEDSPLWLRNRLSMAGIRPINNIVDITNYVMLEMGQPMHAFDLSLVEGGVVVRDARQGEKFTTLDGQEHILGPETLVIADEVKALGIAGIMGGEDSKIKAKAGTVLFESATFDGAGIRASSQKLGIRTDSSTRFEKGLDPNLALLAIDRAVQLVEELGCGTVAKGVVDVYNNKFCETEVEYDVGRINRLTNLELTAAEVEGLLGRLGIVADNGVATIPTFRADITREACIAEEVARLYGYDRIPSSGAFARAGRGSPYAGRKTNKQLVDDAVRESLAGYGFFEAVHFSFDSPGIFEKLRIPKEDEMRGRPLVIRNPLGDDFGIMRTVTIGGILRSLALNSRRRNKAAWLFELGREYLAGEHRPAEPEKLTLGMYGNAADFFVLKGVIEGLLAGLRCLKNGAGLRIRPGGDIPFLHPGRAARLALESGELGYMGELHPAVAQNFELDEQRVYLAVMDMGMINDATSLWGSYKELPKFPGVSRDIALVVREEVPVGALLGAIAEAAGELLENAELFDVYQGEQVSPGYVSLAFGLSFRAPERTLTDGEVSARIDVVLEKLEDEFQAKIRS